MKRVLLIAFHYPPEGSSSGVQRTLTFSRHLSELGWLPIVLTASPRAYLLTRNDQLGDVPPDVIVERAFALDTGRHLALRGRYPRFAALPDRWVSWWLGGVSTGARLIRKYRPLAMWSTYPIATAHLIGSTLERMFRIPWVADFRDSMTEDDYPEDPRQRRAYRSIERRTLLRASRSVFTTPGAVRMYRERYPEVPPEHVTMIPNGYDEETFAEVEGALPNTRASSGTVRLLHSGSLYPSERDPRQFYAAVRKLLHEGGLDGKRVRVVLRATGHDAYHRSLIEEYGIGAIVSIEPPLPYREALREMLESDGLLIFQAASCNHQVPAKIYEYFRAGKPILALTDPSGDTAGVLQDAGIHTIAPLDDEERIATALRGFVEDVRLGRARVASATSVNAHSRHAGARALAELLDSITDRKD